jgi:hypothetical protein
MVGRELFGGSSILFPTPLVWLRLLAWFALPCPGQRVAGPPARSVAAARRSAGTGPCLGSVNLPYQDVRRGLMQGDDNNNQQREWARTRMLDPIGGVPRMGENV